MVSEVRKRLAVGKRSVKKMNMERFNLRKLNEGKIKKQYQFTIKNKFAAQENLENNGDINRAWDAIRVNFKILKE
jgi:glycine betaine/choline ABC-type transport system substrate-binding protein